MELSAVKFILNPIELTLKNISKEQSQALKTLCNDHSLTIREADKGGRMVIMDTLDYNREISSMLDNPA